VDDGRPPTPYQALRVLATEKVRVTPTFEHWETYTLGGLLTSLWHWPVDDDVAGVLVACGGAMGGLLGPAGGLYHDLGEALVEHGIGTVRVGWRKPNDLDACLHDMLAVLELAARRGATKAVTMGHSFGGAVAVQAGVVVEDFVAGVATLATQSAGCEVAGGLEGRPVLCFHGDAEEILPAACSELVAQLSGGELVVLPGTGHLLTQAADVLRERLLAWLPEVLSREAG
jgi:alpha-beta hydrolase superfamily lysophospholipase